VIKALKRLGFIVGKTRGSHVRLFKLACRVTVPNHSSINPKTLQSILKQAQITIEELEANL
jgi:predicted RNA binding protein YcfA (HicA-like mRNA interferase family)